MGKWGDPSCIVADAATTSPSIPEDPVTIDPSKGLREGPSKDIDPGDRHSGEGLASVRPPLARALADSALRTANNQLEAMNSRIPPEPEPETPNALRP